MSRTARATARRRKGSRTASRTTAQARSAMPVSTQSVRSSDNSNTHATATETRSRQPSQSSRRTESPGSAEHDGTALEAPGSTLSPFLATHPPSLAVAVAPASDGAHRGERQRYPALSEEYLLHSLAVLFAYLDVREDLAQQLGIARSIATRYLYSGWFVAEVVALAGMFALCFDAPFDGAYFYRIAGLALGLFALFTTYVLDHAVALPSVYLRRSLRMLGRPTVAPLVFAAAITRFVSFMLLLSLVFIFRRLDSVEPLALAAGAVGVLANCALIVAVTVACSTPFARRGAQLGVLVWFVAALAMYSSGSILSSVPVVSWVLRLPLLPFATCYDFGVTGEIGWPGVAALVAELSMIVVAIALTDAGLRRRLRGHMPPGTPR